MGKQAIGQALLIIASIICVFVGEFPYSLIPIVIILYICLPNPGAGSKHSQRRVKAHHKNGKELKKQLPVQSILDKAEKVIQDKETKEKEEVEEVVV